jgi:hypothetical protein
MKTPQELAQDFTAALTTLGCNQHAEFSCPFTNDMVSDFAQFTLLQSGDPRNGYRSDNPTDSMAKYAPTVPYTDGRFYHTVMDIGYPTYMKFFPTATPMDFYNMTIAQRGVCISSYINSGKLTSSDLVNILLTYIIWGGSLQTVLLEYHEWYPSSTLQADAIACAGDTFYKLADVRNYVYSNMLGQSSKINGLGWSRGITNFVKLFSQYI